MIKLLSRSHTELFFFFSSRRRHTSCSRDWSSDVCSSDLIGPTGGHLLGFDVQGRDVLSRLLVGAQTSMLGRSEERREGKSVTKVGNRIKKLRRKSTTLR